MGKFKFTLKRILNPRRDPHREQKLRQLQRRLMHWKESILGGGRLREAILIKLLEQHYNSKFRRQWVLGEEPPHFFDQRMGFFQFAFGHKDYGPYALFRGFYSSEILRQGDRLLDIGCGDGFFTRRFFAERCGHIDAIDIEPSAIQAAVTYHSAPNITYHLLDAVNQPFPNDTYDVIVWDGAMGHFSPDATHLLLQKIYESLAQDGIFVGSESLGIEGSDHLQYFHSLNDLYQIFKPYFKHIQLRCANYKIGSEGVIRQEAYWRCANDPKRLKEGHWQEF
jgi:SAM-dependent methyltransferase